MKTYLDEKTIKNSLSLGLITRIEARELLLNFLNKKNFSPIKHKNIILHSVA